MRTLLSDLRFSIRSLAKTPGFTLIAVLTLALGIGANATIFSAVKAVLFQRLPFPQGSRMMILEEVNAQQPGMTRNPTRATFLQWRQHARSFDGMEAAVAYMEAANLSGTEAAEKVRLQYVSPGLLPLLGVKPALGRPLTTQDGSADQATAVLLSDGLWKRRFGSNPSVLGRTVRLGGKPLVVVGVLPPDLWVFPGVKADVWMPFDPVQGSLPLDSRYYTILGRLKPGVTPAQAQAEMAVFGRRLADAAPETNKDWSARAQGLQEHYFGGWRQDMSLLVGAVGCVLLIACANVASLLVARGVARRRGIAIRASLGASRWRIARQLLTESLAVAFAGGLLGAAFAAAGIRIFAALSPEWFPSSAEIHLDAATLGFALALSLATAALFGIVPAWQVSKADPNSALKASAASGGDRGIHLGRNSLVITEIALTTVLLVGAGLTMNSFLRLQRVDPGFNVHGLLSADLELLDAKHMELLPQDKKRVTPLVDSFYSGVLERVQALPGVRSAAMAGNGRPSPFRILGGPTAGAAANQRALFQAVSPDYFRTIEQPLVRGRMFTARDDEHSPWVVVINEAVARAFFGGQNPLGKVIHASFRALTEQQFPEDRPREIVGVVADTRQFGPMSEAYPTLYVPNRQHNTEYPGGAGRTHLSRSLVVRTEIPPPRFAEALHRIVADLDRDQTVSEVTSMENLYGYALSFWRFYLRLFGIFSTIAVILAVIGTYGLVSYSVTRRTREFGIRLALGASRSSVARMVLRQGLVLACLGIVLGGATSLALTRLIANLLWKVKPTDPLTYAAVALLLFLITLGACLIPARRSTRVDPMVALRYE